MAQPFYNVYPAGGYEYVDTNSTQQPSVAYHIQPAGDVYYDSHLWVPAVHTERTPRSTSPPTGIPETRHRRRRSSTLYLDGDTIVITGGSPRRGRERERERERERRRRERDAASAAAAESAVASETTSTSRPIPIMHRSSTMPTGHVISPTYETRGRRPLIVEDLLPGETSARFSTPVEVVEHSSSRGSSGRHSSRRHYYDRNGSPLGYTSAEDESNRRRETRRRNRDEVRSTHGGSAFPSSAPTSGAHDAMYASSYTSSYGGSSASGFTPPPGSTATFGAGSSHHSSNPAVEQATKSLRWADQVRHEQNARIAARPPQPLDRSGSVRGNTTKLQGEVKSILKNGSGSSSAANTPVATTPSPSRSRPSSRDNLEGLTSGLSGLTIDQDREYRDRLSRRFEMPPRRYDTWGSGRERTYYTSPGYYPS